jgi:hypothetical protein
MARIHRKLLKRIAILNASMKIALIPGICDLAHHPVFGDAVDL